MRQVRLDERRSGEASQLPLQVSQRHVADEQGQRGPPRRHRSAQFGDRAVLDAGVDKLRVEGAASGTGRADDQPTERTGEQRAQEQAPDATAEAPRVGVTSVVSVTRELPSAFRLTITASWSCRSPSFCRRAATNRNSCAFNGSSKEMTSSFWLVGGVMPGSSAATLSA